MGRPAQEVAPVRQQGADAAASSSSTPRATGCGEFYRIYRETADRAGFLIRTEAAYRDVWDAFRPAGRARLLFAQTADGEPQATLFLVRCGPRVVGAVRRHDRGGADSRANYLLKWEAIRTSREQGATSYDLWGLATGGHRPLQDRVRWSRGPLHRGVGPGPRPDRARGLRGGGPRPRGGLAVATAWRGGDERVGVRGRGVSVARVRRPADRGRRRPTGTAGWSTARAATSTSRRPGPTQRARLGWRPRVRALDDDLAALVLRPAVPVGRRRERLRAARADRAPDEDADAIADAAAAAHGPPRGRGRRRRRDRRRDPGRRPDTATGSGAAGFQPIPEIQPSRHRVAWPCRRQRRRRRPRRRRRSRPASASTARSAPAAVVRATTRPAGTATTRCSWPRPSARRRPRRLRDAARSDRPAARLPVRAARRLRDWWRLAHAAGLARLPRGATTTGRVLGGLILYRHGERLSTVHSADAPGLRDGHPGVMHLLRWRAIQLAIREGRDEMDLGGVDVGPDHREPGNGEPMAGLYEHKRSFGAAVGRDGRGPRAGHPAVALPRWAGAAARAARSCVDADDRISPAASRGAAASRCSASSSRGFATEGRLRGTRLDGRADRQRRASADVAVTGVTHDSRAVAAGRAVRGHPRRARRRPRLRRRGGRDRGGRPRRRAATPRRWPSPQLVVDAARPALASAAAWWYGDPVARADRRRHHRHRRQDDDRLPRRRLRSRPPGGGPG